MTVAPPPHSHNASEEAGTVILEMITSHGNLKGEVLVTVSCKHSVRFYSLMEGQEAPSDFLPGERAAIAAWITTKRNREREKGGEEETN